RLLGPIPKALFHKRIKVLRVVHATGSPFLPGSAMQPEREYSARLSTTNGSGGVFHGAASRRFTSRFMRKADGFRLCSGPGERRDYSQARCVPARTRAEESSLSNPLRGFIAGGLQQPVDSFVHRLCTGPGFRWVKLLGESRPVHAATAPALSLPVCPRSVSKHETMCAARASATGSSRCRPRSRRMPKSGNLQGASSGRSGRRVSGSHDKADTVTARPASTGACVPTCVAEV